MVDSIVSHPFIPYRNRARYALGQGRQMEAARYSKGDTDMAIQGCTRADFLKMGFASAASLAVLGMAGCAPKASGEGATDSQGVQAADDVAWDKEADFVVVGMGAGGLGASLQAIDEGASVIVVEKASIPCGDAQYSHGVIMGSGSRMDDEAGINVSIEEIESEAWYLNEIPNMAFAHYTVEQSGELLDWLLDHDMPFNNPPDFKNIVYSNLPIYHEFEGWGSAFHVLADQVKEKAQEVLFSTRATRLVQDGTGRVVGVVCNDGKKDLSIKGNAGVILCTGGYGANNALMTAFDPRCDGLPYEGSPTNTGDGLMMAQSIGAAINTLRCESCYSALVCRHTKMYVNSEIHAQGGIFVGVDGKRYARESSELRRRQAILPLEVFQHLKEEGLEWGRIIAPYSEAVQATIDAGVQMIEADTIEGLAEKMGIDVEGLVSEISRYNAMCEAGFDSDFRKTEGMVPFTEGPFYGMEVNATVTQTSGGLRTNNNSQVMRFRLYEEGEGIMEPIPGLYAGGQIIGYEFKWGYALSNALTRGRTAVKHALGLIPDDGTDAFTYAYASEGMRVG